ncbi:MAG TPA: hypothetical protein VNV66_18165 [Pilimelia sp.]|nr:hypothetical protein [Pilimelia sp.]
MRGKLWFAVGAAVGFVMGARAGREKYEELVLNARKVWDHPTVQEAAGVVQAQANRLYSEGKEQVTDKLSHTKLGEKRSNRDSDEALATSGSGTSSSTTGANTSSGSNNTGY